MSDAFDDRLRERLDRLSAAIPVGPSAPAAETRPPPPRRSVRLVLLAAALVIALATTVAVLRLDRPAAQGGAFGDGGPLHCTGVDQLAPSDAARWLGARGFDVTWQLEDRTAGTTTITDQPPDHGGIIDVLALGERGLLVLVDLGRTGPLAPRSCPDPRLLP